MLSHVKASNTAFNLEAHLIGSSGIRTHDLSLPSELPCFGVWDHLYNREKLDLRLTKYLFQFKYCLRTSKHVLKASNNFSFQELFFLKFKISKICFALCSALSWKWCCKNCQLHFWIQENNKKSVRSVKKYFSSLLLVGSSILVCFGKSKKVSHKLNIFTTNFFAWIPRNKQKGCSFQRKLFQIFKK